MSHFVCPGCGRESDIFGKGGGERLAERAVRAVSRHVPLHEPVRVGERQRRADRHRPIPTRRRRVAIIAAAERVAQQVSIASFSARAIPLVEIR